MGAGQSSEFSDLEGFQIVSVAPQSPAHQAGLIPFFDFVTHVGGKEVDGSMSSEPFRTFIKKNEGRAVQLTVFNTKTKAFREVSLTPTNTWGGSGLLGCAINWENVDKAQEYVWHVTGIRPGSPAHTSGFQGGRDYVIGMQPIGDFRGTPPMITMFTEAGDFHNRLEALQARRERVAMSGTRAAADDEVLVLLYDAVDNSVREVLVELGDHQSLGCDVARGYCHVIPVTQGDLRLPVVKQFFLSALQPPPAPAHSPPPVSGVPPPPAAMSPAEPVTLQTKPPAPAPVPPPPP
eukprot:Hpha_TRINITY_DN27114_c0_g1::TRINITY_DN27114_c0_g1_i1::g.29342::m.29342